MVVRINTRAAQSRNQSAAKIQRTVCVNEARESHQRSPPVLAGLSRIGRERHAAALRHAEHRSVAPQQQLAQQRLCGKHGGGAIQR